MKIVSVEEAISYIKDNSSVTIGGSGGSGSPEALLHGLEARFVGTGSPKNLTILTGIAPGNLTADDVGMNTLAHEGMVCRAICAHLGMGRNFGEAVTENKFPAFGLPLGIYGHLLRAIAGHQIGVLTHVGLHTFADPRIEGCRANEKAKDEPNIVELVNVLGKEQLLYKSFPIDVALIKGSFADEDGNITFSQEGVIGEQFEAAAAAHNSGGIVIVEVKGILPKGSIPSKEVVIPKKLVDYVVIAQPNVAYGEYNLPIYYPEVTGEIRLKEEPNIPPMPLNERKICGRRAVLEIKKDNLVNLGIGMPDSVGFIAQEEGIYQDFSISVETGTIGGVPLGGIAFGASRNTEAIIKATSCFDMYDGGAIDITVLGCAEVDKEGNVNVSKLKGSRVTGPGGFINITQSTKNIVFIGSFTSGGLEIEVKDGKVKILKEGKFTKFKDKVTQITLSGKYAVENKQNILYVTERAVFKLTEKGLELIEIAPGIDIEKDILPYMEFKPIISKDLKLMDERIFREGKMNLKI